MITIRHKQQYVWFSTNNELFEALIHFTYKTHDKTPYINVIFKNDNINKKMQIGIIL